jgi:hypothetical protein
MVHEGKFSVKYATPDDFERVYELLKAGVIELGENYTDEALKHKIEVSYHLAPCILLEKDGIVIGIAGLTLKTSSWSGDASLMDYMFYVVPDHRSLDNLGRLVEASKEFASQMKLPLRLEFVTGSEAVRKRLFAMYGFEIKAVVGQHG